MQSVAQPCSKHFHSSIVCDDYILPSNFSGRLVSSQIACYQFGFCRSRFKVRQFFPVKIIIRD